MTLYDFLYRHPLITLIVMILSGLTVGTLTLNIFNLLAANWDFISRHGLMALREGAARQLLELLLTGAVSMIVYIVFKVTETTLTDWLKNRKRRGKKTPSA